MTGQTLSHYQIDAELGRGGMGVVYRATDTKLNRTVALKVLPAAALASPDDRARFVREAQSAAQLNHPNIATVYGIDEAVPEGEGAGGESRLFIAMEYIEGETLREHAQKGPMKLHEAVSIAGQVAEALKVAHAKDIVHRDIKSANIMLTGDGVAKVLDFGLAKTNASTMLTRMGSTLGTVAYMSPEQARGEEVDGRSDLYSLGTVMYEMIAGVLPFAGDYEQAVLYGILNETPEPLTAIRTGVPMQLEWIANKLLSKEAQYRYQTAGDLLADLKSLDLSGSGMTRPSMPAMAPATRLSVVQQARSLPTWVWVAMGIAAVAGLVAGIVLRPAAVAAPGDVVRFDITLPEAAPFMPAAWSPDERFIYYIAARADSRGTYLRRYELATGRSEELPGTEGARDVRVAGEGRWLGFLANRNLNVMLTAGGSPTTVDLQTPFRTFGDSYEEGIVFTAGSQSFLVDLDGGTRELPAGIWGRVVFWEKYDRFVYAGPNRDATWTRSGTDSSLIATGYIPLHSSRAGTLVLFPRGLGGPAAIARLDPRAGTVSRVAPFEVLLSGALSPGGHLLAQTLGQAAEMVPEPLSVYSNGVSESLTVTPGTSGDFDISPDGRFLVIETFLNRDFDEAAIYRVDLNSGAQLRLAGDGIVSSPTWSPDGEWIYFVRERSDAEAASIVRRKADGSGNEEVVRPESLSVRVRAISLSPDGRSMAFVADGSLLTRNLETETELAITTETGFRGVVFSPDGRYLAYSPFRSGGDALVVVAETDGSGRLEVAQGSSPKWSPDGAFLYYKTEGDTARLLRRPITTEPEFNVLGEEEIVLSVNSHMHFGLHPDGRIIYSAREQDETSGSKTFVIMNFDRYVSDLLGLEDE